MTEKIKKMIESMTTDELKQRLAEYMAADQQLAPRPIAVEVRLSNIKNVRCRYDDTLNALKNGLDKQYWEGTGEMLDEYLSMMEKGYTTSDFARKYRLTDQQMRRFLDMVRAESRHFLKAAA